MKSGMLVNMGKSSIRCRAFLLSFQRELKDIQAPHRSIWGEKWSLGGGKEHL